MIPPNARLNTTLNDRVPDWCEPLRDMINIASRTTGVPADLIASVIYQESRGNINVNETRNLYGGSDLNLMRTSHSTAREFVQKYPDRFDRIRGVANNIMLGASYLREMYDIYPSYGWGIALEAYNRPCCMYKFNLPALFGAIGESAYVKEVFRSWSDISSGNNPRDDNKVKKVDSTTPKPVGMASNDRSLLKSVDELTETVNQLINDWYTSNLLHSALSVYNKFEYFHEQYSSEIFDDNYYKMIGHIDDAIFKSILSAFNTSLDVSQLKPGDFYSHAIELIEKHYISFKENMKTLIDNLPTNNNDTLTKFIIEKKEKDRTALKSMESEMDTELKNTQYFLTISTIMDSIFSATSHSLMNYMFIFMLHNETTDRAINQSSSSAVTMTEKSRINQQAEYFKKTKYISKNDLCSLSSDSKWYEKFESALTWYFVFSIIKPTLPNSHPIYDYSYNLAQAFVGFSNPKKIQTNLLPDVREKSIEIKELLEKIYNHETNQLLYIISEFKDQIRQIESFGDISFTYEFSVSAAVLITQNRLTELFDLYKTSTGTFGSGMTSSVSTLMENSFRDAMRLIEPHDELTKSCFYLARADLRSKIDDWDGVDADLKCLIDSNIEKSFYYDKLRAKCEQTRENRESILNEHQRIEYLLIRSYLCTSLGEFQDAFTALLDANYMIGIMKSVSSEQDLPTEKKEAPEDDKILSELQSFIETVCSYLQRHLYFSIEQSSQQLKGLSYLQCLSDYFPNLNILIGTFSIKYDEKLHEFAFDYYFKALPSVENYKYFDPLNETESSNMLTSLKKFLETLKERTKQSLFTVDETVFSDFIQNIITFDKHHQIKEQLNPFVQQYYQILKLNTGLRTVSNVPEQSTTVSHQQPNESQTDISKVHSSKRYSVSSDESGEYHSVRGDSPPTTPLDTATSEYYNILSLDGGGIRGIVEAIILMEIEERTGKKIGELFHCFAGTSTGGILACGLAKYPPMEAKDLLRLYLGPRRFEIFNKNKPYPVACIYTTKYSSEGLEKVLDDELLDECLSNCGNHDLIIPTEILGLGSALFINTTKLSENSNGSLYEQRGLCFYDESENIEFIHRHTCDIPLKDVARCTSAASPLFPPKILEIKKISYTFYDGGYKHNQPDSIAFKWATQIRGVSKNNILLLSIGNSNAAPKPIKRIDNLLNLAKNSKSTFESVTEKTSNSFLEHVLGKRYTRITPDTMVSSAMDDIDSTNLQLLWHAAWKEITEMDRKHEFNPLCSELLRRSHPDARVARDGHAPDEVSYYPSRYMLNPDIYEHIEDKCKNIYEFNMLHKDLSLALKGLFRQIIDSTDHSTDPLQYPRCCERHTPCFLSLAAGVGHIKSILHYFQGKNHCLNPSLDPFLKLTDETKRDFERSDTQSQCKWNPLHYAAANGEILAAVKILYDEPLELTNLTNATRESQLKQMIRRLDTPTKDSKQYTPCKLAKEKKKDLMEKKLKNERKTIKTELDKARKSNNHQ